ncbi:hypothetical protein AUK22_06955 [bacterium CG2_30_54_10]|nr:MAG: hypothetical protein AUK22_06955 [bacterium CG2_30_54_10]
MLFGAMVALSGFSPAGPSPDLQQYQRLPLSVRLTRLTNAGIGLFNRRRYEDAITVFESIFTLDPKNLGAFFWIRKCRDVLNRERSEWVKADLYRKRGSLTLKESKYDNWVWGPTVGHFEVRYSKPKPYIPPVRMRHSKASDDQIVKAREATVGGDPEKLFELAMLLWSRGEKDPAIDAYESAMEKDPEIAGRDDEGLLATVADELAKELAKGLPSGEAGKQFMQAGRLSRLQGDPQGMIQNLVKAATLDPQLQDKIKNYLEEFVTSGKTAFLMKVPDIFSFRQAYVFEDDEDRLYLKTTFSPGTPFPMAPIDLMFDWTAIKGVDLVASDVLFAIMDPTVKDFTRLWLVPKIKDKAFPTFLAKLRVRVDKDRLSSLDLSNVNVSPDLPDNWCVIVGTDSSFGVGFPTPEFEDSENSLKIKAFQLGRTNGRAPSLTLRDFHIPAQKPLDMWRAIDKVGSGI